MVKIQEKYINKNRLEGEGLIGDITTGVRNTVSKVYDLNSYNKTAKKTLEQYGDIPITKFMIRRKPVNGMVQKVVKFVAGKEALPYDQLFHLSLIVTLQNGKEVIIEKSQVLNIDSNFDKNPAQSEFLEVPNRKKVPITINELLNNTVKYMTPSKYFSYEALKNNCQVYILSILRANKLSTAKAKAFIMQDMNKAVQSIPSVARDIGQAITTGAEIAQRLTGGKEKKYRSFNSLKINELKAIAEKMNGLKNPKYKINYNNLKKKDLVLELNKKIFLDNNKIILKKL